MAAAGCSRTALDAPCPDRFGKQPDPIMGEVHDECCATGTPGLLPPGRLGSPRQAPRSSGLSAKCSSIRVDRYFSRLAALSKATPQLRDAGSGGRRIVDVAR
jgi:hypothetical protein